MNLAVEVGDGRTLFSLATKKEVVVAGKVGGAAGRAAVDQLAATSKNTGENGKNRMK